MSIDLNQLENMYTLLYTYPKIQNPPNPPNPK